ncbi:MAG: glycosyltransferase family 1 protein, partial [Candidatus Pacebacteria bacterium]|nr:glycosyltransferase family 1 protein [Candidatus Paceibacterota bacterium]
MAQTGSVLRQFAAIWLWESTAKIVRQRAIARHTNKCVNPQRLPKLFIDVSIIAANDAGTGIQRVVRSLLLQLIASPPSGFEIKLVRATRNEPYRYTNDYLESLTSVKTPYAKSDEIDASRGDVFLGLDLTSRIAPRRHIDFLRWRVRGVRCAFVVYDLLPILHPEWFTQRSQRSFRHWLRLLAVHADTLFCISNSVAKEVRHLMLDRFDLDENELPVEWFHLGAD